MILKSMIISGLFSLINIGNGFGLSHFIYMFFTSTKSCFQLEDARASGFRRSSNLGQHCQILIFDLFLIGWKPYPHRISGLDM